jgi:hypothetical protein
MYYELWWSDWDLLLLLFGGVQDVSKTYGSVYKMDSRWESFDTSCCALLSAASGTLWRKRVECRVRWSGARAVSVSVTCYSMFSKSFSLALTFHSDRTRVAYITYTDGHKCNGAFHESKYVLKQIMMVMGATTFFWLNKDRYEWSRDCF